MKPIREKKFSDDESGITSDMIDDCNDPQELLKWKMIIESNIVSAQLRIDLMKGEQAKSGIYADPKSWVGVNAYRRAVGFLSQKIQHRLREVNYNKKVEDKFDYEGFYYQAKKVLPNDVFNVILKLATKNQQEVFLHEKA